MGAFVVVSRSVLAHELRALSLVVGLVAVAAHGDTAFTFVVIPDSQDIFSWHNHNYGYAQSQVDWILDRRIANKIAAVAHVGDIIHHSDWFHGPDEMGAAWDKYSQLNTAKAWGPVADLAWGTCGGNHDYDAWESWIGWQHYVRFFGPSKFGEKSWYVSHSPDNINSAQAFRAMGYTFLLINISSGARDEPSFPGMEAIAWARGVIAQYPGSPVIINTHAYLGEDGPSLYEPSGSFIWKHLVDVEGQVFMVVSGHTRSSFRESVNSFGHKVYQVQFDMQSGNPSAPDFLGAYLRLYEFDPRNGKIHVKSYSPVDNSYLTVREGFSEPYEFDMPTQPGERIDFRARFGVPAYFSRQYPDFDGDGKTDFVVYRQRTHSWVVRRFGEGEIDDVVWGETGALPVVGDYDGDGLTDYAYRRLIGGAWSVKLNAGAQWPSVQWGSTGDVPVPTDLLGHGRADFTVWRPGDGTFRTMSASGATASEPIGQAGDIPCNSDYDGDGRTDACVYRPSDMSWHMRYSGGGERSVTFGRDGYVVPVPGDYLGDSRADLALWNPTTGHYLTECPGCVFSNAYDWAAPYGAQPGDVVVPGDYNGDGKTDYSLWRTGNFFVQINGQSTYYTYPCGEAGDVPVARPAYYELRPSMEAVSLVALIASSILP